MRQSTRQPVMALRPVCPAGALQPVHSASGAGPGPPRLAPARAQLL